MRVWLYARLSNDDNREMNSLLNQQEICQAFAEQHGYIIVGQSFDDNISGMSFDRRGLDELTAAVDADMIDAVIVKDLSRLGRHRTQTALFIDYLREHQVRVISATEGVDTFRDEDDLIIGVRGLMNDYYAKDIGKKIRAGYRQKQKDGIVITPPFGYWKDRNTWQIKVDTEAAVTVQLIYSLYLQGCGQKEIARRLNAAGRKTPAQLRAERCGREVRQTHKTRDGQFLWTYPVPLSRTMNVSKWLSSSAPSVFTCAYSMRFALIVIWGAVQPSVSSKDCIELTTVSNNGQRAFDFGNRI